MVSLLNYVSKLERVCRSINANVKKGVEDGSITEEGGVPCV